MDRLTENKIILVVRQTRLDDLVAKYNTLAQAQFYVEHLGADFSDYLREDQQYKASVIAVETALQKLGRIQILQRKFLSNFVFGKDDLVIVLGQDGLVANTMKYLQSQLVIGVNPDPARWDGVLLPFETRDLDKIVREVFAKGRKVSDVTMAKAVLSNGQNLYAVNDLFIGAKTHVSARYNIRVGGKEESHSSSGIIVSTGLGSTGWLKSVIAGATGIFNALAHESRSIANRKKISWDAQYLYFSVREPFPSKTTSATMVFGKITGSDPMILVSHMPENGVIFSDGIENDFLEFNSGMKATIGIADKSGHLVV
ncbi:MAG: sugar kinase [Planctomycetota bacterium]